MATSKPLSPEAARLIARLRAIDLSTDRAAPLDERAAAIEALTVTRDSLVAMTKVYAIMKESERLPEHEGAFISDECLRVMNAGVERLEGERQPLTKLQHDTLTTATRGPVYGESPSMRGVFIREGVYPVSLQTVESLARRGFLAPDERGGYVLTDSGRDILRLVKEGAVRVRR